MFPIFLSIEGLYSYKTKQTIDFRKLTPAGLFGIFGKTGSGKSTVLEAITYSIFGRTDRMNASGDDRNYNMMNLESDKIQVSFEFLAGREKEHFRCEFIGKRNSKNFEKVNTYERKVAKKINGNWQVITDTELHQIIGLSYDNFKRTVIIPQGQFAEFLQLTPSHRTAMVKDIFELHDYDLAENTKKLLDENKVELEKIQGIISHRFDYLTENFISEKQEQLSHLQVQIKTRETEIENKTTQKNQLEIIKSIFEEKAIKQKTLVELESQKAEFKQREKQLQEFILLKNELAEPFKEQKRLISSLEKNQKEYQKTQTQKEQIQNKYLQTTEEQTILSQKREQSQIQKNLIPQLEQLIDLQNRRVQSQEKQTRIKSGEEHIQEQSKKAEQIKQNIASEKENILKSKVKVLDTQNLQTAFIWLDKKESLVQSQLEVSNETQKILSDLERIKTERADFEKNKIEKSSAELEKQLEVLKQKIEKYTMQKGLQKAVSSLHEGEPCPVCGSEHHPNILNVENIEKQLSVLKKEQKNTEKDIKTIQKQELETTRFKEKLEEKELLYKKWREKGKAIQTEIKSHQENFLEEWKELDKSKILKIQEEQKQIQTEIRKSEEKITKLEQSLETEQQKLEKYKAAVENFRNQKSVIDGQIQSLEQNTQKLESIYLNQSEKELQKTIKKIETESKKNEEKFLKNQELEKQLSEQKNQMEGTIKSLKNQVESTQKEVQELQNQVIEKIKNSNQRLDKNHTQKEIEDILVQNLNADEERQKITTFFNQLQNIKAEVEKLEAQTKGKSYQKEEFEKLTNQIKELSEQQKEAIAKEGILKQEIQKAQTDTEEKAKLEKQLHQTENRNSNLKTLESLFKGKKFVDFASTEYLHNLCQIANIRFSVLTNNSLELILNEKNEFVVRDFLNEGKLRAIKTLSGGQLFQASLCVALALSESMKRQQEFFFIDEGFGALDNDSLETVLKTLETLRKDNKVVGIISHVESLKLEIPIHLQISQSQTEGSKIKLVQG